MEPPCPWYNPVCTRLRQATAARRGEPAPLPPLASPDYAIYHRQDELVGNVSRIVAASERMSMERLHRRAGNYSAEMDLVTVAPTSGGGDRAAHLRLLLDFGQHAREFISSEVGLRLLELLADEEKLIFQLSASFSPTVAREITRLLRCCVTIQVIPLENSNGRALVEREARLCERKNGRGVDPNRNWAVSWGNREKDYSAFEEYPGTGPFSEPEVALVRDAAVAFAPHVWIAVHSGMDGLFMPYDHVTKIADGPHDNATLAMMRQLNRLTCRERCVVGSGGASVGYLAHGTATDYMFSEIHVPVAMTWEIYGDDAAEYQDCFRMFNPLTRERYADVVRRWTDALLETVLLMRDHPAVAHLDLGRAAARTREADDASAARAPPARQVAAASGGAGAGATALRGQPRLASGPHTSAGHPVIVGSALFCVTLVLWCLSRRCLTRSRWRTGSRALPTDERAE